MKELALLRLCRAGFLVVSIALILATVQDYGISWDESFQATYGDLIVSYFRSGGTDLRVNEFSNLRYYGPGTEPLSAWLAEGNEARVYLVRHLVSAAAMLLTFAALLVVGEVAAQAWIGMMAAVVLALMPMFWGHGFVNSKDVVAAMAFSWFMAALLRVVHSGKGFVLLGVAIGVALECRPGLLPLLAVFVLLGLLLARREQRLGWRGHEPAVGGKTLLAFALGWILMVAPWPWAHENVLMNPLTAIWQALNFSESYRVLFAGTIYESQALPRWYLIWHLIIGMPLVDVALVLFGFVCLVRLLRRKLEPAAILVLAWVAIPVGLWTLSRSNIYDGMRHFLFVLPGVALIVAAGVRAIFQFLTLRVSQTAASVVVLVLLLAPLPSAIRLHPYEMTFFNSLAGGMAGAARRYDTDYWLTSYKEAMEWINTQAEERKRVVKVLVAANSRSLPCAAFFRSDRVEVTPMFARVKDSELPPEYDYYLATTRYGFDQNFGGTPIVHRVGRLGATFSVVKGRTSAP